jgi:hypothetical protein
MTLFEPGREKTGGRRKGARNRISTALLEALAADLEQFGEEAIKITRIERPSDYLKICAALIPQAFDETVPLTFAVTRITRTIIDPKERSEEIESTPTRTDELRPFAS